MPFIGKQPQTGAYSKLDSITTSATATYNLTLDGGAYYPQSANHLLVSLNGVMQAPQDSFTVSGSQITFASALTSSDNIDFIMALGDTLDIGVPSAGSVNTSQLADGGVTTAKINDGDVTATKLASTLDLSGKTLTVPSIISRQLIKVYDGDGTQSLTTTDTSNYTYGSAKLTITPETSSDIFIFHFQSNWNMTDAEDNAGIKVGLYMKDNVTTTIYGSIPATTNHAHWQIDAYRGDRHPDVHFVQVFEAPSTNELEFGFRFRSYSGGAQGPYAYQKLNIIQIINGGSVG